ncbi:DUF4145 domain-containing protein [Bacillus pumilus]|uniref:DUF4145 domain-containing protein n=1 Tax=Bacillus pumilus TaxID=1408 RepID=UPI0011A39091|nr:DUF4145 domain-containing protein [Bacillus pumilus]
MLVAIIIWQEVSHFISSLLNSKFIITILTSWPLAVVVIVMLLRKGILDKLKQLDSFNYKDGTANFIRDTLKQVKTNQTLSTDNDSNQSENDNEPEDFITDSYIFDPVATVLVNWMKLEEVINEACVKLSSNNHIEQSKGNKQKYVAFEKINFLENKGLIDNFTAKSLHGLRRVRNEVAHGMKISEKSAEEFTGLCNIIAKELKNKIAKDTQ